MPQSPRISFEASPSLERRAFALSVYLADLHATLETGLKRPLRPVKLIVLSEREWAGQVKYPYGFTFYRRLRDGSGLIFAPGDYPGSLTWVFKSVIVQAQKSGKSAPGALEEFFDLTLGHELGHAIADQLGLRTRVRWLDEFLASYLYVTALEQIQPEALARVLEWGRVLGHAESVPEAESDGLENLIRPTGKHKRKTIQRAQRSLENTIRRVDLGAFEFPFERLPIINQAWFQAQLTFKAAELVQTRGFEFAHQASAILPQAKGRSEVHRALLRIEPSFKPWFAGFGNLGWENARDAPTHP